LMDQAVQVYAGTAARSSAVPTPSTGMVAYSTATGLQVFDGSAWTDVGGVGYGEATGGASTATISVGGESYTLLTFTSDSTLTVTKAGLFDVLMFGGGGGGANGRSSQDSGGGGGAGGVVQSTLYLTDTTYAVDIGAGGADTSRGFGSNLDSAGRSFGVAGGGTGPVFSSENVIVGACGGGGAGVNSAPSNPGGGAYNAGVNGYAGGNGVAGGINGNGAGGGGGVAAVGVNGSGSTAGAGGAGYDVSAFIGGSALFKGGGGGGGSRLGTAGAGGSSVGGAGGQTSANGSAAAANTASGGGGAAGLLGGAGGSGIVYIRFKV
jgi:hypothetical protein